MRKADPITNLFIGCSRADRLAMGSQYHYLRVGQVVLLLLRGQFQFTLFNCRQNASGLLQSIQVLIIDHNAAVRKGKSMITRREQVQFNGHPGRLTGRREDAAVLRVNRLVCERMPEKCWRAVRSDMFVQLHIVDFFR